MKPRIKYQQGERPHVFYEEDYLYRGKSGLWYWFDRIPKNGFGSSSVLCSWAKYILKNGQVRYFEPQQKKI